MKNYYKNFDLISKTFVTDCDSDVLYLRHRNTGLEVVHICSSDEENLFAFAFRTPVKNSTGAAHILEHSVFCGSQKFPLKEPFTNLMNQSVNTFLNALTYPDKTVYPASSTIKDDYFNLFRVYADAVFFPLLRKETFMQEAYRLEVDEKDEFTIQGVVYNEMKGCYSSFDSVASDFQFKSLLQDTNYSYDSGGDPLEIPSFTYDDFKEFHKKYYRPDNCILFLYGNIPTEEQLDFVQKEILDRLEKKFSIPKLEDVYPSVPKEFVEMETPLQNQKNVEVHAFAPDSGSTGSTVTMNWLCGQTTDLISYMECIFLCEALAGNDGAPIVKALVESELGDDLAPGIGVSNDSRYFTITLGLHGVKSCDEKKVYNLIEKTLQDICKNGLDKKMLESAVMSVDFANREIVRGSGPYALVLLERVLSGWNYGKEPALMLKFREAFKEVKNKLSADSDYVLKLIKKYLLENTNRSYVIVEPSKDFLNERNKKEALLIEELKSKTDLNNLKEELKRLYDYQSHRETLEETSCIPSLKLSGLKTDIYNVKTEIEELKNKDSIVPLLKNTESTNGIAYIEVYFPVDVLFPEDYPYLPVYSYCATNLGWNNKRWWQTALDCACVSGGMTVRLSSNSSVNTELAQKEKERLSKYNCVDRDWLVFSIKCLSEKLPEALKLFTQAIATFNFNDLKRMKTLIGEISSGLKASVIPRGNRFAAKRVQCLENHACTVDEIWRGFSQLFAIKRISSESLSSLKTRFENYSKEILSSGSLLHVTTDSETMPKAVELLKKLAVDLNLKNPVKKLDIDEFRFKKLLLLPGEKEVLPNYEFFVADAQVGFSACTMKGSLFGSDENPAELVLAHWLSGDFLWERLRTKGGAYGAYASSSNMVGSFNFATFRDPSPEKSVQVFEECLKDAGETLLDKAECTKLITGTYGDEVQPSSPASRGALGFLRTVSCIVPEDRKNKLEKLLKVTPEQVQSVAKKIYSEKDLKRCAIICDSASAKLNTKSIKNASVIIKLPL